MTQPTIVQNQLTEILDKLGPGLRLEIDDLWLARAFGYDAAARQRAEEFAKDHHCGFIYNARTCGGIFIRAYFKDAPSVSAAK